MHDLREYQKAMLELASTKLNLIVVAPTGSGKTLIAIEHSHHVLKEGMHKKVVFLAPTNALTRQQTGLPCILMLCLTTSLFHMTCDKHQTIK